MGFHPPPWRGIVLPVKLEQTNLDVFKDLECAVIEFWRENSELSDHAVGRAYEAVVQAYDAEQRGRRPRPHHLTGLDLALMERLKATVEYRLGRAARPETAEPNGAVHDLTVLVRCLRELAKSVEFHGTSGGRQGYLQYVASFLPKRP